MILQVQLTDDQFEELAKRVAIKLRVGKADTYSVREAANVLGVSPKTVQRRVIAKLIPRIANISPIRIPAAWVDQQVNPNPDA